MKAKPPTEASMPPPPPRPTFPTWTHSLLSLCPLTLVLGLPTAPHIPSKILPRGPLHFLCSLPDRYPKFSPLILCLNVNVCKRPSLTIPPKIARPPAFSELLTLIPFTALMYPHPTQCVSFVYPHLWPARITAISPVSATCLVRGRCSVYTSFC